MNYQEGMAAYIRANTILAPELKQDENIWLYHCHGMYEEREHTQATVALLQEEGYQQINLELLLLWSSVCFDVRITTQEKENKQENIYWVRAGGAAIKNIMQVKPVVLAAPIEKAFPPERNTIWMANPLPLPQHGDCAFVLNAQPLGVTLYHIEDLPKKAQKNKSDIQTALLNLAGEIGWPEYTMNHATAHDIAKYAKLLRSTKTEKKIEILLRETNLGAAPQHIDHITKMLSRKDWSNQWKEIQHMVYQLATDYSDHHEKKSKKRMPHVQDGFKNGYGQLPTFPTIIALVRAETAPVHEWVSSQEPVNDKEIKHTKTHRTTISGGTVDVSRIMILSAELQEQQEVARDNALDRMSQDIAKMADRRAQFHIAQCIQVLVGKRNENGMFYMTAHQMLNTFGVLPKRNAGDSDEKYTGGHRWEDIREIDYIREKTEGMRIKIAEVQVHTSNRDPKTGKVKRGRAQVSNESAVWVYRQYISHQPISKDGTPIGGRITVAWEFAEGEWMRAFMGDNMAPMTGTILQKIIQYDPYHARWEFRIGTDMTFWFRLNAKKAPQQRRHRSIREILERVGLLDEIDKDHPIRAKDRLEKAMSRLVEDECLVSWKYAETEKLPTRNWLEKWLDWHVIVEEPTIIRNQNRVIEARAKAYKDAEEAAQLVKTKIEPKLVEPKRKKKPTDTP